MKVLMTADAVGGVWNYSLELARALKPHGVEILLATMGARPRDEQRSAAQAIANVRLVESDFALEWMPNPWRDVERAGEWLLQLESEFAPDIVHLGGLAHGALPLRAPKLVVAHSDVLGWWRAVKDEAAPPEWSLYQQRVQKGLHQADCVVAPTQAMLDSLRPHYDFTTPSRAILNGCDTQSWQPQPKEPFIFAAGRLWDEAKNLALLNTVAPQIPWPIYVAGANQMPDGSAIEAANVHLLGRLSEAQIQNWMSRAAIYCLPARYEPFGLSVLEAALSGCALVLGNISTLREIWGADSPFNLCAEFVSANDARTLEKLLLRLIEEPDRRERLARMSRARAQEFSSQCMARRYFALYREMIAVSHKKSSS